MLECCKANEGKHAGSVVTVACNDATLSKQVIALRDASAPTRMTATALAVATGILDVTGAPPRRRVFAIMAQYATDELERQRLQHFSSAEGRDELALYCSTEKRSLLEVEHSPCFLSGCGISLSFFSCPWQNAVILLKSKTLIS
jgi:hypothetical protein